MRFETERMILRPWEDTDCEELYKYAKDERVGPPAGWHPHTSVSDSLRVIRTILSAEGTYAVVLKESGLPVGSVGITRKGRGLDSAGKNEAELGCWIGFPYWGQGLIPEALRRLQEYCFTELGCTKLWYAFFEGNHKSERVMEKLGFEFVRSEPVTLFNGTETVNNFCSLTREKWKLSKQ